MKYLLLLLLFPLFACQTGQKPPQDSSPVTENDGSLVPESDQWGETWRAEPFCDTANREFDETVLTPPRACH